MVAGRVTIGLLAVLVGRLGLLHLARGAHRPARLRTVLQESGGLVEAIARPLARLLSHWGRRRCSPACCSSRHPDQHPDLGGGRRPGIGSVGRLAGSALTAHRPPPRRRPRRRCGRAGRLRRGSAQAPQAARRPSRPPSPTPTTPSRWSWGRRGPRRCRRPGGRPPGRGARRGGRPQGPAADRPGRPPAPGTRSSWP